MCIDKMKDKKAIYHYTNWKAFEGILVNKTLRLSNVSYSNDANEILFGLYQLDATKVLHIYASLECMSVQNTNFINCLLNKMIFQNPLYAICFSKNKDDVAQWERYAQSSCGVCIGFNKERLKEVLDVIQLDEEKKILTSILYSETSDKFKDQLNNLSKKTKKLIELYQIERVKDELTLINPELDTVKDELGKIVKYFFYVSKYMKHPSFNSEKEIRLGLGKNDLEKIKNYLKHDSPTFIKYEADKDRIREFVELDLEHLCKDKQMNFNELIDEIIIGPKSIMDESLVISYLTANGLEVLRNKVKKSTSSIR